MKMPDAWLTGDVATRLADGHANKYAPVILHGCILSFTAGTIPHHLIVRAQLETHTTRWRAMWLHEGQVGYAHLSANIAGWGSYYEADHGTVTPEEVIAWARPTSSITQTSLIEPDCTSRLVHGERSWSWAAITRLHFPDGETVELPLFGTAESEEEEEQVAAFLVAVASSSGG